MFQILQYVYFFYVVVNNQTPSLRQGASLLRENINTFMNIIFKYILKYIFKYVSYLHIQGIQYDSITL